MKKLILIGLPGSGKTTVGGLLARQLGLPFRDCDPQVERLAERTVASRPLLAGGGSLETLRRQREALYRICADYTIREDTAQAAAEAIAAIWRKQT